MAKVKFGMFMTDARGKVGGQVFSKNRSGSYVRTKVTPSNPRTERQSVVRQALGSISAAWSALTTAQISGWNAAVANWQTTNIFGDSGSPSGKTLFAKLNLNINNIGGALLADVPQKMDMPVMGTPNAAINLDGESIQWNGLLIPAGVYLVVSATPVLSRGTRFFKGKFRQIGVYGTLPNLETGAYDALIAKFGEPAQYGNMAFELKYVLANGQASTPMVVIPTYIV